MKRILRIALLMAALTACFAGGPKTVGDSADKPLTLMLQWLPQAQFAGYYVALEKGFYRDYGLDVRIIRGGPDRDGLESLKTGEADYAILFLSRALWGKDQGIPLVHLAQVVNKSNLMLVGWKANGIDDAGSFDGKKVSMWDESFNADMVGWFDANKVRPHTVPQYYSVNLFLKKGVDACSVMYYNEYHMLYQAGIDEDELATFFMKDYGFGFPEDGIYCLANTLKTRPQASRAFIAASLDGWKYTAKHPEEALDIVMKYVQAANLPTNRAHMRWMLEKILPSMLPDQEGQEWRFSKVSRAEYERTAKLLVQHNLITAAPSYEGFGGEEQVDGQ